ncbi:MAG: transketolase [Acidobacteria bacterium]|nr:MAG: transketolase [Acidobacteriota bacterium]
MNEVDRQCVNTLRFLAVDAVESARSGHPGLPLGAAPMAYVLWDRFLRHNPTHPSWFNRDRFILSAGHGSALLYALLHLTGYDLPLEELQRFRQWGSRTPGHPEYGHTPGVEATTSPLGQGFAMGVGMAVAERFLATCFNRPGFPIVDHHTYALVSDGDLMEGISSEAASLAGTLGLGKLVYLYDDNHISIEGETDIAFTENVKRRFEAYGWQVLRVADGNDLAAIERAIDAARAERARPSLIIVRTHIGYGSPKQDMAAAHGEPLGPDAVRATKEALGWPLDLPFYIPEEVRAHLGRARQRGAQQEAEWRTRVDAYGQEYPELAAQLIQLMRGEFPPDWDMGLPVFHSEEGPLATRSASGKIMNALAERLHHFIGGSADLAPSTKTLLIGYGDLGFDQACARNIHFGVREHAMGAIVNGMALHGIIPYGATFLVFSDYMRPTIRLAALMQTHSIFIFTHDSIGLGEDGPTHQPVEQVMSLRLIPGLTVLRPADANETTVAWRLAIERRRPVALVLTRQKLPVLDPARFPIAEGVPRGSYVLAEATEGAPDIVLMATGSEVHLILAAREALHAQGIRARVVSMPSWELFDEQVPEYRHYVLPSHVPKLAVEAGTPRGWRDYVGATGDVIGVDRFGASAPGHVVLEKLGFTVEHVVERARALVGRK